jgi:hypothetical protein
MKLYYDGFASNLAVQLRLGEGPVLKVYSPLTVLT